MYFKYITKTAEPPKESIVLGYKFTLDGDAVEVRDEAVIKKLKGMAHVGYISLETPLNRDELKKEAKELGIKFVPNIKTDKLSKLVEAKNGTN